LLPLRSGLPAVVSVPKSTGLEIRKVVKLKGGHGMLSCKVGVHGIRFFFHADGISWKTWSI